MVRLKFQSGSFLPRSNVQRYQSSVILQGTLYALGAACFFGASPPLTKLFLAHVQPWMLAGFLFLGGGLGLMPFYLLRRWINPSYTSPSLNRRDWGWLLISLLFGGVLAPAFLTLGLSTTPASVTSLLLNFEGVFTALLAWTLFRERWNLQIFFGILVITTGGMILSQMGDQTTGLTWGAILILGTCFGFAMDSNCTKKIADKDSLQLAILKSGVAGMMNVAIALALGESFPSLIALIQVLGLGFVCFGLTLICFILALRHLGSSRTGAYFSLSPFVGASIGVLFLGEGITPSLAIAASLMGLGTVLCVKSQP